MFHETTCFDWLKWFLGLIYAHHLSASSFFPQKEIVMFRLAEMV